MLESQAEKGGMQMLENQTGRNMKVMEGQNIRNGIPLSSDPMINLNTTVFTFFDFLPFARNLHNLEPLALTMMITKEARK